MLQERFQQYIKEHHLFRPEHKLLLAVSGGADSVAMAHLCAEAGFSFAIAHCNFRLRGAESDRDEAFVRSLGQQLNVPVLVKGFDTRKFAEEKGLSVQEAARELRYGWFFELLQNGEHSFSRMVTAHHADDNVETVLMYLFRGTGIRGLTGIPIRNAQIVRPLLFARRSEIENYLKNKGVDFVQDSSNASEKYDRNFIRNKVLPLVREHYAGADENILSSIGRFCDAAAIYSEAIHLKLKKLMEQRGAEWHIPVRKLKKQVPLHTIVYEMIRPFGFTPAQNFEVIRLLDAHTGRETASATHRIIKNRDWLIITPVHSATSPVYLVNDVNDVVKVPDGIFSFKETAVKKDMRFPTDPFEALVDGDKISFPLIIRKWKTGDYFYPLGMRKKKKLARFFIDLKLSKTEKENVWVMESNKKIIWLIGYRIDDRVKITDGSVKGLCLLRQTTT